MLNKVILIGNVGKDPETFNTDSGLCICKFSLATTEKYKDKKETEWHRITAFGKIAELCEQYVKKGSKLYLEGKIKTEEYESKDGSGKKYTTGIIANTIKFLDSKQTSDGEKQYYNPLHNSEKQSKLPESTPDSVRDFVDNDDDLPF